MTTMIELPQFAREAEIRAQSFDEAKRTVDLIWTTGATVRRRSWMDGPYDEELIVSGNSVRLERLNAGAPFLNAHDGYDLSGVIGSVVPGSAKIEKGRGTATVQLSKRDDVAGIAQDIRDGIIRNISVGYRIHAIEKKERDDGSVPLWRVVDWEPLEISAVPIPADPGAQVRDGRPKGELFPCTMAGFTSLALVAGARMRMQARELGLTV
jgi:HK97 family phage prohead protease